MKLYKVVFLDTKKKYQTIYAKNITEAVKLAKENFVENHIIKTFPIRLF